MSTARCLCCHLSLFFRSRFTLPFLGLPAVSLVCPLFYSVCKGSQLRLSFFFLFCLSLLACLSLAYSSLYSIGDGSISCWDAQLLWNALIPLAYVQDIVSVPFKSNGFGTGKALISAAHCCICVDARCWPHSLSGLRESVCFPLKPSALHNSLAARVCMTEMARQIKKGLHIENEVEAACWEKDRRNATGIWWLVGERRGKWQRVRGSNWFG